MGLDLMVIKYEILLATYNGARFLSEQLNSISSQILLPSRVLVSDDSSSDDTVNIIKKWSAQVYFEVSILPPSSYQLGCRANFEKLLNASRFDYVMFADQDDIWDVSKAQRMLDTMIFFESRYSTSTPLVVHSDLRLIREDGSLIAPSYFKYQGINSSKDDFCSIALQNIVTGCSCIVNRSCIAYALPFPSNIILHDWWIALVTSYFGKLIFLPEPTLGYRQHSSNLVGALGVVPLLVRRFFQLFTESNPLDIWIGSPFRQLRAFSAKYILPEDHMYKFIVFLFNPNPFMRLYGAYRLGLSKHGAFRTLTFYILMIFWKPGR